MILARFLIFHVIHCLVAHCPAGARSDRESNVCYKLVTEPQTRAAADVKCRTLKTGGVLVNLATKETQERVKRLFGDAYVTSLSFEIKKEKV